LNGTNRRYGTGKCRAFGESGGVAGPLSYLIDRIEPAKETLRGESFYDLESYKESLFLIDKWLEVLSTLYFPTRLTVVDNQFGNCSIYSSKDLMKIIRDEAQNPTSGSLVSSLFSRLSAISRT